MDDIVEGIVAGVGWLERNPGAFEIVNLGNSETVELNRLIRLLGDAMGIDPEIEGLPEQRGDVRRTWADVARADRLLDWRPFLRDRGDDLVLEVAVSAGADAILTHEQRGFEGVESTFGVRVLTPGAFLRELETP